MFLIMQRNDSLEYDGTVNMWTGATSIDKVGQISEWNFSPNVNESIYTGKCSNLTGSAGEFFPPKQGKDVVDFFSPDLCRYAKKCILFFISGGI